MIDKSLFDNTYPYVDNMDVQKTESDFDYAKWEGVVSDIYLKKVNGGINPSYDNHVYYADESVKLAQFTVDPIKHIESEFILQSDSEYIVETPIDYIRHVNYMTVVKGDPPVPYKTTSFKKNYFYFVKDMEYISPNSTKLIIELDVFNTYINDVNISKVFLERGHYPVEKVSAETYLSNPYKYTKLLMGDEGVRNTSRMDKLIPNVVSMSNFIPFNSHEQWVCFALTVPPLGGWNEQVPEPDYSIIYRIPTNVYVIGCPVTHYQTFLDNMREENPQMVQTIKMMFVVDKQFISVSGAFTLNGVVMQYILGVDTKIQDIDLDESMFDFPTNYKHIAKLYTSDFCKIVVNDHNGNERVFNVEDTTNNLNVSSKTLIDHPFLEIHSYIGGVGNNTTSSYSVKKFNVTEPISIDNGKWNDLSFKHEIPTFIIYENAYDNYEFNTRRLREHQHLDNTNTRDNKKLHNDTIHDNSVDMANNTYDNAVVRKDVGEDLTLENIGYSKEITHQRLRKEIELYNIQNATYESQNEVKVEFASGNANLTALSQMSDMALDDDMGFKTFAGGMVDMGVIYGRFGNFESFSDQGLLVAQLEAANRLEASGQYMADINGLEFDMLIPTHGGTGSYSINSTSGITPGYNVRKTDITNNGALTVADNNRGTLISNANRLQTTEDSIADVEYSTREDEIVSKLEQQRLTKPVEEGYYSGNGYDQGVGTFGITVQIRKVPEGIIEEFGDTFLRYGYVLNQYIDFETLHVMPKFTYWKIRDVVIDGNVSSKVLNQLFDIFKAGITLYRDMSDISTVTIYDNK